MFRSRTWHGGRALLERLEKATKSFSAAVGIQSSAKAAAFFFAALLLLLLLSASKINLKIAQESQLRRSQSIPITFNCPNQTQTAPFCQGRPTPRLPPYSSSSTSNSTCPDYFRWIYEDLRPWSSSGITREMVEEAKAKATFRLVVVDGRVYVEEYIGRGMSRNVFTLWGILQLVNRYPGRVPDLELMFNCLDQPAIKSAEYGPAAPPGKAAPPPLFHYCNTEDTMDILFPDWSFWGWPEVNTKPWESLMKEMKAGNEKSKWKDRVPYAFWRGLPHKGLRVREDLMKCNASSNGKDWNARLYIQTSEDWKIEEKEGFRESSNLANQCQHRYKIYVEGAAWSVSRKYILACDSPMLLLKPRYEEFFTRGMIPGTHFWPINVQHTCSSIKFAVDWGNAHQDEAEAMGKAGSDFIHEDMKMDFIYDYMLHLLEEYAKLLKYKPTIPEKATEYCLESMACNVPERYKKFLLESKVNQVHDGEPCKMPPPFRPSEFFQLAAQKKNFVKQVEMLEQKYKEEHGEQF